MRTSQTWREQLGQLLAEPGKRQQISEAIGVSPITLVRWVNGKSRPRLQTLSRLLRLLPNQHEYLLPLILKEFPDFPSTLSHEAEGQATLSIPAEFYRRVTRARAFTPPTLLYSSLQELIIQEALKQLDPARLGMAVTLVCCTPPPPHGKVRSLLEKIGRGTTPWLEIVEQQAVFFGFESLAGHAVTAGRLILNQHLKEPGPAPPGYRHLWETSAASAPIMQAGRIAACLQVSSAVPHYFTPQHLTLVEAYAELLALAFPWQDFYPPEQIKLGIMPPASAQQPVLETFRYRVSERLSAAFRTNQYLTVPQAEQEVWQQLEEVLLPLSASMQNEETKPTSTAPLSFHSDSF